MAEPTSDDAIRRILGGIGTIAMVGASAKPDRPSHGVMHFLQAHGYRVIPVNPGLAGRTLFGEAVHATLRDITERVDMVDIFRAADHAGPVVADAIAIGARVVWMQLGVVDAQAAALARASGLEVVMDRCPKIEIVRLRLPAR